MRERLGSVDITLRLGSSPHQKINDQHNEQYSANPRADHRAAVIVSPASTKEKQQDDDNQNNIHVSSGMSYHC